MKPRLAALGLAAVLATTGLTVAACNDCAPQPGGGGSGVCVSTSKPSPAPPPAPAPQPSGQPQFGTPCDNPGQRIGNAVCDPAGEQGYPPNTWHPA